jgi:predicted HTH transcriptional regulator
MSNLSSEGIIEILESGNFKKFISHRESEFFEVKSKRPYNFPKKGAIREFIKDIASFANNRGGIILFGLKTDKAKDSPTDLVKNFDLVSEKDFYEEALLKSIIKDNIYPRLNIIIGWYPNIDDKKLGLGFIKIPEQNENNKYFIIKALEIDGDDVKEFYGIPIRNNADTQWLPVSKLHKLSKRSPSDIQKVHQNLTSQIDELKEMFSNYSLVQDSSTNDDIMNKIEDTINGR